MRRVINKLKQNNAFTLPEILAAMGILIALMSISFLSYTNMSQAMKMTENDNYAKTIYMEAQYRLSAKEVEGGLTKLYAQLQADYAGRFLEAVDVMPQDFDDLEHGEAWKQLCYIKKGDPILDTLFPNYSSIDQIPGNFLLEINPQTGDVYSVFYWDEDSAVGYQDINNLVTRDRADRSELQLGYFGGDTEVSVSTVFNLNEETFLVNDEELYLKVSFEATTRLLRYYNEALTIVVTIADEHDNHVEFEMKDFVSTYTDTLDFYLLLDSMADGYDFKTITGGHLVPGDNLTITVDCDFVQGAYEDHPEIEEFTVNSLFYDKYTNSEGIHLGVTALRHLRNLNSTYFTVENATDTYTIHINDHIDYLGKNFDWNEGVFVGESNGVNPLDGFHPLVNDGLFRNSGNGNDKTAIIGGSSKLSNFVIEGYGGSTGLIGEASYLVIQGIHMVDCRIYETGSANVGMFIGNANSCHIDKCGAYLTTSEGGQHYSLMLDETGQYSNEMERRCNYYYVLGTYNVGGLVGNMSGASGISESFAAINVVGSGNVGGLVGNMEESGRITNSYSSGDVYSIGNNAGGLVGMAKRITVTGCYSTADLFGADYVGGIVGMTDGGTYTNCDSFGQILDTWGTTVPSVAGGIVGRNNGGTYSNCRYLQQEDYNNKGLADGGNISGITKHGYTVFKLADEDMISPSNSYPYDVSMIYKQFPFASHLGSHYGSWPSQYRISNSLVYYEEYADGSYGYYCETTFSEEVDEDGYIWVLDSLQDKECISDGYALLSMHNLQEFSYELFVGSVDSTSEYYDELHREGVLTVANEFSSDREEAKNQAVYLRQQGALTFRGYAEQVANYKDEPIIDTFIVDGMYLYQLPYDLQCTKRAYVNNFYDRLIIYNGMQKGAVSGADPVVGGTTSATGVAYFYCPHFAKTAVNPNTKGADEVTLGNPEYVFVRSARQLNALGRNEYYWNVLKGFTDKLNYVQEVDINFGTYDKEYCGQDFDLMDMNADYRNVPIGEPALSNTNSQFRHNYDGGNNKIIDYCVYSSNQFVGLFGEVEDCVIKNVHMTVSSEGAGKIIGYYRNPSLSIKKAGTGALVGLAYMGECTIENCSASGYDVQFILSSNNNNSLYGIAMGGLVGFSMSSITNCSADNNVILDASASFDRPVFMGGLAGSFFFGTLSNCYSGGTIDILNDSGYDLGENVRVAGVCPGYFYTAYKTSADDNGELDTGDYFVSSDWKAVYKDVYSYTQFLMNSSDCDSIYGSLGNQLHWWNTVIDFDPLYNALSDLFSSAMTFGDSYYLDIGVEGYTISSGERGDKYTYDQLVNLKTGEFANRASAIRTYPTNSNLVGVAYPFPAFVTDTSENTAHYVHYGNWPYNGSYDLPEEPVVPDIPDEPIIPDEPQEPEDPIITDGEYVGILYRETYNDGTYGYYAAGYCIEMAPTETPAVLVNTIQINGRVRKVDYFIFYKDSTKWEYSQNDRNYMYFSEAGRLSELSVEGMEDYYFREMRFNGHEKSNITRYFRHREEGWWFWIPDVITDYSIRIRRTDTGIFSY